MEVRISGIFPNVGKPAFKAGKVELFSDFDNTYCPVAHGQLKNTSPANTPEMTRYCRDFRGLLGRLKKSLTFHITTGRTFGEYKVVSELIRKRGFELPLPDTLIVKNGGDEYLRRSSDTEFYRGGRFPFSENNKNFQKEREIKALTGWDGKTAKSHLKSLLTDKKFKIVEADSENCVYDYGEKSLLSKIPDERKKIFSGSDKPAWTAGLRNDGYCKIFVTYPPDIESTKERKAAADDIEAKFFGELEKSGVKYYTYTGRDENYCYGRPYRVIEPMVDENLTATETNPRERGLTKLYDTKNAVERAKKNNDLVLVSGDGANDFNMLNIFRYIDLDEYLPENLKNKNLSPSETMNVLMKRKDCAEIVRKIRELPITGIVVKNPESGGALDELTKVFGEYGPFYKIITVENGELDKGIKKAVKLYASQNPRFAEKMSPALASEAGVKKR